MAQTLPIPATARDLRSPENAFADALDEEMTAPPRRALSGRKRPAVSGHAEMQLSNRPASGPRTAQATPRSILALPFDTPEAEDAADPAAQADSRPQQPIRPDRGLQPAAAKTQRVAAVPCERLLLLRDIRRAWMGSAFKRVPHTLVISSVRLARVPGANAPAAETLLSRTSRALAEALRELGILYTLSDTASGMLLTDKSVRQATKIAEAIQKAIDARASDAVSSPIIFAAGVAAIHRDDDPVAALCLAERCLTLAEREGQSSVIAESDARVRTAAAGR